MMNRNLLGGGSGDVLGDIERGVGGQLGGDDDMADDMDDIFGGDVERKLGEPLGANGFCSLSTVASSSMITPLGLGSCLKL